MKRFNTVLFIICVISPAFLFSCRTPPASRKANVLAAIEEGERGLATLSAALEDEDFTVRRTAAHGLALAGKPAENFLRAAILHDDAQVGRIALAGLASGGSLTKKDLAAAMDRADEVVRLEAVRIIVAEADLEASGLLAKATGDESSLVRAAAFSSIWKTSAPEKAGKFDAEVFAVRTGVPLRERYRDDEIETLASFPLPEKGWKFRLDPGREGYLHGWHLEEYGDSSWDTITVGRGTFWQNAGYDYVGTAWYRNRFEMPQEIPSDGVEIYFGAVDSNAWVWINEEYVGDHRGPWDAPFALDITEAVEWGRENHIAVRAMSTGGLGGIWQPVEINILKTGSDS